MFGGGTARSPASAGHWISPLASTLEPASLYSDVYHFLYVLLEGINPTPKSRVLPFCLVSKNSVV
jgi:hypothetical protein